MIRLLVLLVFFHPWNTCCQFLIPPEALRVPGDAAYGTAIPDLFSGQVNPAALPFSRSSLGMVAEQKFLLKELTYVHFALVHAKNGNGLGMYYTHAGSFSHFQQSSGLSFAKDLGKVSIGIEVGRHDWKSAGYAAVQKYTGSLGFLFRLSPHCSTGMFIAPLLRTPSSKGSVETMARKIEWGVGYEFAEQLHISLLITKTEGRDACWRSHITYIPVKSCRFQGGYRSDLHLPWFGTGWQFSNDFLSLSLAVHPVLGATPGIEYIHFFSK